MARIAHVQGLRGCLYTLRCFHIPTYRFHGTVSACNSPKVTTSLGQRWASGCFGMAPSCQFLAQNTHTYTPLEKGRKALLERLRQGM